MTYIQYQELNKNIENKILPLTRNLANAVRQEIRNKVRYASHPDHQLIILQQLKQEHDWNIDPKKLINDVIKENEIQKIIDKTRDEIEIKEDEEELNVIMYSDLKNIEIEEKKPLIQNLINKGEVELIAGKPNEFKTFGALAQAVSIASGKPFLNLFETTKSRVTFIDEENGIAELKKRVEDLVKGLEIKENLEIAFISNENLRLDEEEDIKKLEDHIKEFKPEIIFVDTLRSCVSFQENDSGAVADFFAINVKPLIKKYGVTFVFLHHNKKGSRYDYSEEDMDKVRGSTVLSAVPDNIFTFKKVKATDNEIIMKHVKCRTGARLQPQRIELDWNDGLIMKGLGNAEEIFGTVSECCQAILDWGLDENKQQFTRAEVNELCSSNKWSSATSGRAIEILMNKSRIKRIKRGLYEFCSSEDLGDYA